MNSSVTYPSQERRVSISGTAGLFVGPNPKRRAICFFSHPLTRVTLSNITGLADANSIIVNANVGSYVMRYDDWGDWLRGQINAITDGGAITISVVEVFDP